MRNFKIVNNTNQYLNALKWENKLAVATSMELIRHGRFKHLSHIYCFDKSNESIYGRSLSILVRNNFSQLNELNRFIDLAKSSGLINQWLKQYQVFTEIPLKYEYTPFQLDSIMFELVIYIGIASLATIVLVLELIVNKQVHSPNARKFWRYIEIVIDPYRHFLLNDLDWSK